MFYIVAVLVYIPTNSNKKSLQTINAGEGAEKRDPLYTALYF